MKKMKDSEGYKFMVPWGISGEFGYVNGELTLYKDKFVFVNELNATNKFDRSGMLVSDDGEYWEFWCPCRAWGGPLCDDWSPTPIVDFSASKLLDHIGDYEHPLTDWESTEFGRKYEEVIAGLAQMIPEILVPKELAQWAKQQIQKADVA